ncbi:hypothetical protein [Bdellovibrio sp. HCB274]|uniref:hypothetical protein n=1 Tax=Bdellovibrio sp. HCB274 TaxID=3394361 RepID=UPI0039B45789
MKLKKISVVKSNNSLDALSVSDWVYAPIDRAQLKKLRSYIEANGFKQSKGSETDFVVSALSWVSNQWQHDGFHAPPASFQALDILKAVHKKNERFRCVEYGVVLAEVLQAFGFITRSLALRSNDVAYGGYGQGHVVMEVWLNDLQKWIFLDPQFGTYLTTEKSKIPLNYYEIFKEKKAGRYSTLAVKVAPDCTNALSSKSEKESYKAFLKEYFGHITVYSEALNMGPSLLLEQKGMPLAFQGLRLDNALYMTRPELFYPEMNRVAVLLSYTDAGVEATRKFKTLGINSDEDYLQKMALFAVKPSFRVVLKTASKIKESYQYRTSPQGKWVSIRGNSFEWSALQAKNDLEVRLVNEYGRPGPSTYIKIAYK